MLLRQHSLFCALRPPRDLAYYVVNEFNWLRRGDDRVAPDRLHVTLAKLGAWLHHPGDWIGRASAACGCFAANSFRVVFDELVVADHVLLKPSEPLVALDRFQQQLVGKLADAGLVSRRNASFSPHITTSYRSRTSGRAFVPPVSWLAQEFVLIESIVGERRHVEHGRWRLT
jgi:2'-5' RNA ligase